MPVADADLLDRVEVEPAGEDGQPAEEHRLVRLQQVVAPLQGRGQRLLARRCGVAPVAEDPEPVVEPLRDRRRAQSPEPARCELERERQPVEAEADARDVLGHVLVEREPRRRRSRALDEQRDGLVAEEPLERERLLRIGDVERRDSEDHLPGHAQRLPARREDRDPRRGAEQPVRQPDRLREHVLAVVEHEQQRPGGEEVGQGVAQVLRREGADVERRRDRLRHEPRVRQGAELDERGTRLERPSAPRASSSARRVLPAPPVPVSVSSRVRPRRDPSSESSRLRPMNELASEGSANVPPEPSAAASSSSSSASCASSSRRSSTQSSYRFSGSSSPP